MPAFTKLIRGAEHLKDLLAEEKALPFPDAPGALTLYHGSPHSFENFDFENNLRRGEGAMAYGPGGYMTGNRALAEHYANTLYRRHAGSGSGQGLANPFEQRVGGRKIQGNLGALNSYFLDTAGGGMARDEMGNLASMGARPRSKYSLSMDGNLDPWSGVVSAKTNSGNRFTGMGYSNFPPGARQVEGRGPYHYDEATGRSYYDPGPGRPVTNPHGTLSGMLGEDKDATLRYLQYKEAVRAIDRNMVDLATGRALIQQTGTSPGWPHYVDKLLDAREKDPEDLVPTTYRTGAQHPGMWGGWSPGGLSDSIDWRLTPRNADRAMRIGEDLNKVLDPHMDLRMFVDRPRRPSSGPSGKAPWLYSADFGAGPNQMLLYDRPMRDQAPRVRSALSDMFDDPSVLSKMKDDGFKRHLNTVGGLDMPGSDGVTGETIINSLPQDITGMRMMREAGIPATTYLRAGPRAGGPATTFDPSDYNFVIHDQGLLDAVMREKLK